MGGKAWFRLGRWVVVSVCVLMGMGLGTAYGAPKVSLSTNRIDLGTVRQGSITKAVVEVKNIGDQPLQIVEIKTSCPCATTDLPEDPQKRIVAPGAALPLTILYDSKDYIGDRGAYIIIGTNDPEQALSEIELGVNIQALIITQPEKIVAWGLAPRGEVIGKDLTVQPGAEGTDIELLDYRMKVDTLTATAEKEATKQGSRIKVKFQIAADAPLGALDNELTMRVRIENEEATIVMPVKGDVVGDVLVMPPAIICAPKLGYTQGQPLAKDGIIVRASRENQSPPDVLGVICVGPMEAIVHKNVKPDWGTKADRHIIEVRTAPNAPAGAQGGTLFVMTSSKDTPIVTIPVFFRMEPRVVANPANVVLIPSATAPAVQRVELKDATGAALTVKDLRFENDIVDVQIENAQTTDAEHPATILIKSTAVPSAEKMATVVSVATDQPGADRVLIPVLIRGAVAAPAQ